MAGLFVFEGEEPGGGPGNEKGDNHDTHPFAKRCGPGREGKGGGEGGSGKGDHQDTAVVPGGGDDDGDEHGEESHGERVGDGVGEDVAGDGAQEGTAGPAGPCGGNEAVGIGGAEATGSGDADGENLVGHAKGDEPAMPEGDAGGELLGDGAGHEAVAEVDDELGEGHGGEGSADLDDAEAGELARAGEVTAGEGKGLEGIESDGDGLDAEGEGDGEVARANGEAIAEAAEEKEGGATHAVWLHENTKVRKGSDASPLVPCATCPFLEKRLIGRPRGRRGFGRGEHQGKGTCARDG